MDLEKFLTEIVRLPGVPGYERGVNQYVKEAFRPYADEVTVDAMYNVIARVGSAGPRVMISAHQDEIGLAVTEIEQDGCLRFTRNGGVDPRILPGMEVEVQTQNGPLYGVIGAKPPHLLSEEDRRQTLQFENLYIDIGYGAETARKLVRVGDPVVFRAKSQALSGGCFAAKTMDDRASIASMLIAAEEMSRMKLDSTAYFVSSVQEEIGLKGAATAAYALNPDYAIAIDVTHGEGPGTGKWEAFPLEKMTIVCGPNIHPTLYRRAEECAKKHHIPFAKEVCSTPTGTDANAIQVARDGIPTLLLSIPLRYMHTTVETLKLDVIRDVGRLTALLIQEIARDWEELKWY